MKKTEKDIVDFLMSNKDFRDWVLYPSDDRSFYWEKWMGSNRDKKAAVSKARNAILKLKFKEDRLDENELGQILENVILHKKSARHPRTVPVRQLNLNWWVKIAASFLLIAFSIYAFRYLVKNNPTNFADQQFIEIKKAFNPEGRKSRIALPDGSMVNLNAESTLLFPAEFNDSLRIVELKGEAFFDVVENKNKPFIVKTNDIETRVLGTTFNVRAFEDEKEINVALVSGKVRVTAPGKTTTQNKNHILLPGEKLTYNKSEASYVKSPFDITEETGWKDEILVFKNTDFKDFITLLERWYGVEINVTNAPEKKWSVNGRFKNESLEEVLIGVQFTYEIEYEIENKIVTLNCR